MTSASSSSSNHVVLINFHGGFPPCYESAAREHLETFRVLADRGCASHTRVYPTNACAGAALHDLLMDAPLHTMTDACWHSWSKTSVAMRSVFTTLRDRGYTTHVLGAYGLDARFDQHRHMRDHPYHLEGALDDVGVDVFDVDDAAFTCRTAVAHDCDVLERLGARLAEWKPSEKHAVLVNLLGCQDVHRCSWADAVHEASTPVVSAECWSRRTGGDGAARDDGDARGVPASAFSGDPRASDGVAERRMDAALRRMTMLTDHLRGETHEPPSRETLTFAINALHRHVWSVLCTIDARLAPLLRAHMASDSRASYVLFADHGVSLYEHGVTCEAPWDACTRGFLCACTPATRAALAERSGSPAAPPCGTPACVATLVRDVLEQCTGSPAASPASHPRPQIPGAAVTLSVSGSHVCRSRVPPATDPYALPYMWARAVVEAPAGRVYAVVYWWSIDDMARETDADGWKAAASDAARDAVLAGRDAWTLPLETRWNDPDAAFDVTVDPTETHNLMDEAAWTDSAEGRRVLARAKDALDEHRLRGARAFRMRMPPRVRDMCADTVALCSVQVRPGMRYEEPRDEPRRSTRDASTQTLPGVMFAQPVVRDVADPPTPEAADAPPPPPHPALARARAASASTKRVVSVTRREAMRHERMRN